MPCGDSRNHGDEQIEQLDALLCSACRELEERKFDFDKNPSLAKWWHEHKREDSERLMREHADRLLRETVMAALQKPAHLLTESDKRAIKAFGARGMG